jgi:NhaA family Na+:H+ antiporter
VLNHLLTFAIFFLIGVEIRDGLSHLKEALLPIFAALGGMFVPALIYIGLQPGSHLWATVMPTDVALALGVLTLIGKKAPVSARLFLMTLAVADDFFSLVTMGIFFRNDLSLSDAFFTIGAALLGGVIPMWTHLLKYLTPVVSYLAVPAYIVINLLSKISFEISDFQIPSAIILARIVGKVVGIGLTTFLLNRYSRLHLPNGLTMHAITGIGFLCGMGMTVSLVIAEIAESSDVVLNQVRTGLFISAFASALLALAWFKVIPASVFVIDELRNNR